MIFYDEIGAFEDGHLSLIDSFLECRKSYKGLRVFFSTPKVTRVKPEMALQPWRRDPPRRYFRLPSQDTYVMIDQKFFNDKMAEPYNGSL